MLRMFAQDYHIEIGGHYFSVPSELIRNIVDARITVAPAAVVGSKADR